VIKRLENFQRLLIGLIISVLFIFSSIPAFPLEFSKVEDEYGVIDNVVEKDGEIYLLVREKVARELMSLYEKNKILENELETYRKLVQTKESIINNQEYIIQIFEKDRVHNIEIAKSLEVDNKWYQDRYLNFIGGFITSSIMFGYWSYTVKRGE